MKQERNSEEVQLQKHILPKMELFHFQYAAYDVLPGFL